MSKATWRAGVISGASQSSAGLGHEDVVHGGWGGAEVAEAGGGLAAVVLGVEDYLEEGLFDGGLETLEAGAIDYGLECGVVQLGYELDLVGVGVTEELFELFKGVGGRISSSGSNSPPEHWRRK
jgi:hypothetical protein